MNALERKKEMKVALQKKDHPRIFKLNETLNL